MHNGMRTLLESLSGCDPLSSHKQVQNGMLPDVADCLFVRDHREIVAVAL